MAKVWPSGKGKSNGSGQQFDRFSPRFRKTPVGFLLPKGFDRGILPRFI